MAIQFIELKLFYAWSAPVGGILGLYVFLESTPTDEDFLTKLYNRKSYETHLQYLIMEENLFGVILIDLDDFKVRLGGDEVAVILNQDPKPAEFLINKLKYKLKFHDNALLSDLKFAIGCKEYKKGMDLKDLYAEADSILCLNKRQNKGRSTEVCQGVD